MQLPYTNNQKEEDTSYETQKNFKISISDYIRTCADHSLVSCKMSLEEGLVSHTG